MGIAVTTEGVAADGSKILQKYTTRYDGKDVPISGSAIADTVAMTRIDPRTISADGKTLTVVTKGTNAQGKPVNNTAIYEKQ